MTYFFKKAPKIYYLSQTKPTFEDSLKGGTYTISIDDKGEFFLTQIENFTLPSKIYGSNTIYAEKIFTHFKTTPKISGALLQGLKGSGKTLAAKEVCSLAYKEDIPVLVLNNSFAGTPFNNFIESITQPCIIFIDEFEKVYSYEDDLNSFLTFLDGVVTSHKLVLMTANTTNNLEYLLNRPGRVYYNIEYGTISNEIVLEYLADNLTYKDRTDDIVSFVESFNYFTIDMLTALVKEINRYNEDLETLQLLLNLKPDRDFMSASLLLKEIKFDDRTINIKEYTVSRGMTGSNFNYFLSNPSTDSSMFAFVFKNAVKTNYIKFIDTFEAFKVEDDYDVEDNGMYYVSVNVYLGKVSEIVKTKDSVQLIFKNKLGNKIYVTYAIEHYNGYHFKSF